jgi:hypothetical protein
MTRRRALYAKPGAAAASGVLAPAQAQQQQQQQQGAAAGAPGAPPLASEASLASLRAVPRTLLGREESDVSGQVKRQWEWHATGLNMACVGAVAGWFSAGGVAACRHLGTPARQLLPSTVGGGGGDSSPPGPGIAAYTCRPPKRCTCLPEPRYRGRPRGVWPGDTAPPASTHLQRQPRPGRAQGAACHGGPARGRALRQGGGRREPAARRGKGAGPGAGAGAWPSQRCRRRRLPGKPLWLPRAARRGTAGGAGSLNTQSLFEIFQ